MIGGSRPGQKLTAREQQVSEYLCLGWTNREIADVLQVSIRTVECYRAAVYDKMVVRNSVELVRKVYGIAEFGPDADKAVESAE